MKHRPAPQTLLGRVEEKNQLWRFNARAIPATRGLRSAGRKANRR